MACKRRNFVCAWVLVFLGWSNKAACTISNGVFSDVATVNSAADRQCFGVSKSIACVSTRGGGSPEEQVDESMSSGDDEAAAVASAALKNGATTELRLQGKEAHDKGDFVLAAEIFQKAANLLQDINLDADSEEYATCRLHQALCHLKSQDYVKCLEACTNVLEESGSHTSAVRARAYHRRAKAKLALEDQVGALEDARSAAFLGDRKAVALYGRLMRGNSSSALSAGGAPSVGGLASSNIPSASLFESLLSKSNNMDQAGANAANLLLGEGAGKASFLDSLGFGSSAGSGSLAKSVMSSLLKRIEDDKTQASISTFLQSTDKDQLQQYAAMAGISIPEEYLDRIENVCHGITPRKIKRTVSTTKGAVYVGRILRRLAKVVQKYKSLLIALALFQWTKSAILRPIPIDRAAAKRAAKATKTSTKSALNDAMKANRLK